MRAGRLDRRITIKRKSITQNDFGEEITTWVTVATVWAQKIEARGAERFSAQQFIGHAVTTFRIRWSTTVSEITAEHQISFDGRDFDVTDIREIGRREGIEIDAYASSELPLVTQEEVVTGPLQYFASDYFKALYFRTVGARAQP